MDNMVQQTQQFGSILSTSAAHNSRDNKTKDSKILQGKFNKLIYAKVVLWLGFFVDALSTTKQFSLTP